MIDIIKTPDGQGHCLPVREPMSILHVERFPDYGKLSGRALEDMMAGRSGGGGRQQRETHWISFSGKAANPGNRPGTAPGDPGGRAGTSNAPPWGRAFWAKTFDIHGGGKDLIFPHHENEIAQSEAAFGVPFVRYWLHNGFVNINNEKMSKSLGNFFTIRDILQQVHPEALRLFVLSKHYRSPVDFSDESIAEAERGLEKLYGTLAACQAAHRGDRRRGDRRKATPGPGS